MGLAKTLIHVLGIGPLFLYIGIQRDQVPEYIFQFLGIVGLLILIYHSVRAFAALQENKSAWINWIHIFLIAPLLLLLAYMKKDASRRYFEMMLLLGFSAVGYHGLYLIKDSMFS